MVVQFSRDQQTYTAEEGDRLDIAVTASTAALFDIAVSVSPQGTPDSLDYYLPPNPLTIPAGKTSATLPLYVVPDLEVEDRGQVRLRLSLASETEPSVRLGEKTEVLVTITSVDVCSTTSTGRLS